MAKITDMPRNRADRLAFSCTTALRNEERGEYERAMEALSAFWNGPGTEPDLEGLPPLAQAQLLLRAGSLTGLVGNKRQVAGAQEVAKDLLSKSAEIFLNKSELQGWAETQKVLALCYWREGAFPEARVIIEQALPAIGTINDLWLVLKLNLALVERWEQKYAAALRIYEEVAAHVHQSDSDLVKGHFHNGLGLTRKTMGANDAAIVELTAASYHFERAEYTRGKILAEINVGNLLVLGANFEAAHMHFDNAERWARNIGDEFHLAHTKDSRALAYLAQRDYSAAEREAGEAVRILEKGDEAGQLLNSLLTHARSLSRLGSVQAALALYVRAYNIAADKIGSESAARVAMEIVSELAGEACLSGHITFDRGVQEFERSVIARALAEEDCVISKAAVRLGLSQQALSFVLKTRHEGLRPPQRTGRPRKASVRQSAAVLNLADQSHDFPRDRSPAKKR